MAQAPSLNDSPAESPSISLREQVRTAVIWRSGAQILGQLVTWTATFLVIRILSPADYGLYAMTAVVLNLLALVNGYGLSERHWGGYSQRQRVNPDFLVRIPAAFSTEQAMASFT